MRKNGTFFISIIAPGEVKPSIWDPYSYRTNGEAKILADYINVAKPRNYKGGMISSPFYPIEYRHIPTGQYLTFVLEFRPAETHMGGPAVGEQQLLFGTMRAYLGNVLVTPKADWIGLKSPLFFPIKSEFVLITPQDHCPYFWWAYFQSTSLLSNLSLGSGGTRPRLHEEALLQTPVQVPDLQTRQAVHEELKDCAEREWKQYMRRIEVINSINL
jgi:hypothetical protein